MAHSAVWIAGATVAVLALVVTSSLAAAAVAPASPTYTVVFSELGLPKGTSWTVSFNGVSYSSTKANLTIKSVSAASSIFWSTSSSIATGTGIQYVTSQYYGYMTVPNQHAQGIAYTAQYEIDVVASPSNAGSTEPYGNDWYEAGYHYPLTALSYGGYSFTGWSAPKSVAKFGAPGAPSTYMTVKGPGTVTASFKAGSAKVAFVESGLPSGTTWGIVVGGVTYTGSTATINLGKLTTGTYGYSVSNVAHATGVEYEAVQGASGSFYTPWTSEVSVVFEKAYLVTLYAGTGGSVTPYSGYSAWIPAGNDLAIDAAASSGYLFKTWTTNSTSLVIAKATSGGTAAVINGPGDLNATFTTGTQCSSCSVTFTEIGLPKGTTWSLGAYLANAWVYYTSAKTSITITGLTAYLDWQAYQTITPGTTGTAYETAQTSGYLTVPSETNQTIVYTEVYAVAWGSNTNGASANAPGLGNPAWIDAGSTIAIFTQRDDYVGFQSWSSTNTSLAVASPSSPATFVAVNAPGTITADFQAYVFNLTFTSDGLPAGTGWSVVVNSQVYTSSGSSINVTGLAAGNYGWYPETPLASSSSGTAYFAVDDYTQEVYSPYGQTFVVAFYKGYSVSFATSGTTGGSVAPSSSAYYASGTVLAIAAVNGTSANFSAWSTSGSGLTLAAKGSAATFLTITASGTVTAKFV